MQTLFIALTSRPAADPGHGAWRAHSVPHKNPDKEADEEEEGLELPVNPDEGTPLIPDEEGNVEVPV